MKGKAPPTRRTGRTSQRSRCEFIARGFVSRHEGRRTGIYHDAASVLLELDDVLAGGHQQ